MMGIPGEKIILEADGSEIEDDDALQFLNKEVLLILGGNEIWSSAAMGQLSMPIDIDQADDNLQILNLSDGMILNRNYNLPSTSHDHELSSLKSTITWSSTALSSSDSEKIGSQCATKLFENFQIPWNKFPEHVKELLELGQNVDDHLNNLIHLIVVELRQIAFFIPTVVLRQICHKLVAKYPSSFIQKDEVGNDTSFNNSIILTKLINHNNYLNRKSPSCSPKIPLKKRKLNKTVEKSCINWQPTSSEDYDKKNSECHKAELKTISSKIRFLSEEWKKIIYMMDQTYSDQRVFLNESPSILLIEVEWPFLLRKECMFPHFNRLMNTNIELFPDSFRKKKELILRFGKTLKNTETIRFFASKGIEVDTEFIVLEFIYQYFKEDINMLYRIYEVIYKNYI